MEKNSEKLTTKDIRDLVIQSGLQAIPYVGSAIASAYYGSVQERRFKRIENYYNEIAEEIKSLGGKVANIESHDKDALVAIIEEINEYVEKEQVKDKQRFLKNYFKNTLINPIKISNFDQRKVFLDTLAGMSILECELIAFLYSQTDSVTVGSINRASTDKYAIAGAIGKLKSYGFVSAFTTSFSIGDNQDNSLKEKVKISEYGKSFYKFCLTLDV